MASQFEIDESDQNGEIFDPTPKWYILKCQVNREDRVKRDLDRRIDATGLREFVNEVYVPVERVKEFDKNGRQREVKRKLYPGYILVNMVLNENTWFLMRETNGVGDFAGSSGRPMPARDEDVERLLKFHDEKPDEKTRVEIPYVVGDRVKVVDGPFNETEGVVGEVDVAGGKVSVNIKMFGKDTPIQLEFWQVEKFNPDA